jgi:ATP-dependent DNA ligase
VHKHGGVGALLLGLYEGDRLRYVGHTSSFSASERRELLKKLEPMRNEGSFGDEAEWGPGGPSRWSQGKEAEWFSVEPTLVCEVSYDYVQSGYRFRHAARFLHWRDDKRPEECLFDQVRD